jgi:hypothetical protein
MRQASATIDESMEWSEDDLRDASLASLRRFDAEHPDEEWGDLLGPEQKGAE